MRVRLEPIGLDVLDDLVASGDLQPWIRDAAAAATLTVAGTVKEWTVEDPGLFQCVPNIP
jgi:hypothetical protein